MGTGKVGFVLNGLLLSVALGMALVMMHHGAMTAGFLMIIVAMAYVFMSVNEWYETNDPLEQYAPGGAKYTPTPWNTERVAVEQE